MFNLNHKKMNDLMKLATETIKVSNKKSVEPVNESLLRILFKEKQKLTRDELKVRITVDRINSNHSEAELEKMSKDDKVKMLLKVSKTVKNGLDTSISRSNNNSSFHYNPKYKDYKLTRLDDGRYQITKS